MAIVAEAASQVGTSSRRRIADDDWGGRVGRAALASVALVLIALACVAPAPPSGDSAEYLALARQVVRQRTVTFSGDEAAALNLALPELRGGDGRYDLVHFWMFPLLASPLVAAADGLSVEPQRGFALVNALCLITVAFVVNRRWGPWWAVVFTAGPIVWWVTRTQVEVFTYTTIALGAAWAWQRPARTAVMFGLAATQNPPLALLTLPPALYALARGPAVRDRVLAIAGLCLAVLHPLYYLAHLGRVTPLVVDSQWHRPGWDVFTVLIDTNVGLLWHAPVTVVVLLWALLHPRAPWVRRGVMLTAIAVLLVAFVQAQNVNHGGTPSVSRYALWLIPLALLTLPEPRRASVRNASGQRATTGQWTAACLAVVTIVWTLAFFTPRVPDSHLAPSRLAAWAWSSYPALENPPTEIFAERLRHSEPAHTIAATLDCAKILMTDGEWPSTCPRVPVTDACAERGAICYANRTRSGGYQFVRVPRR